MFAIICVEMSVAIGELIKLVLLKVGVKGGPDSFSVSFLRNDSGADTHLGAASRKRALKVRSDMIVSPILVGISIFITSGVLTY